MANVVITEVVGKNYHKVDFGNYSDQTGFEYMYFWADDIVEISKGVNGNLLVEMINQDNWVMKYSENNIAGMIVDSVLGVNPSSNDDLATLIADLKG